LVLTLDAGNYSIEVKIGNDIKEEKFTIGGDTSKLIIDMSSIKKEQTKEELIKADTQKVVPTAKKEPKQMHKQNVDEDPKKALEVLGKMFGGLSKEVGEKDAKDMEKAGEFLKALGGLMGGTQTKEQQAIKKQKEAAQKVQNEKADKEFDEMSQELDMFTK
jgi:truncated hemoglobin YjbI